MDWGYMLGSTFKTRCGWIWEIDRRVRAGQLPPAYQRTVVNLSAAYFFWGLLSRHLIRVRKSFSPVELLVSITDWCPHQCRYCYNRSGQGECKATYINLDRLNVILDEVKKAFGIRFAVITGGEPFPYVLKLAQRRPDFTFFVYTSGNISERACQEMVKLGNIIPALTIVDVNPEVHDYIRGSGSFQRIMTARTRLQSHQLPWGWSLTSSRINFQQLVKGGLLDKLASYQPYFIRAMPWMPVGRSDEDQVLSLAEMAQVGSNIREAQQRGIVVFDYITAPVGYPCLAGGRRSFFVAPDGKGGLRISPCVFMEGEVSVPITFRVDGSSTLLETLQNNPWFVSARDLAGRHQCIIHANRSDWPQLVRGEKR
ncbi:MAG: radical SAM protein [Parcubacteria group bacterium]|nr:radical SAM protein [Parcubacteria group bacterium]